MSRQVLLACPRSQRNQHGPAAHAHAQGLLLSTPSESSFGTPVDHSGIPPKRRSALWVGASEGRCGLLACPRSPMRVVLATPLTKCTSYEGSHIAQQRTGTASSHSHTRPPITPPRPTVSHAGPQAPLCAGAIETWEARRRLPTEPKGARGAVLACQKRPMKESSYGHAPAYAHARWGWSVPHLPLGAPTRPAGACSPSSRNSGGVQPQ